MHRLIRSLFVLSLWAGLGLAQTAETHFTVSGVGLPSTLTIPTSDQGQTLNRSLTVMVLVISNTSGSQQTVSVQDCGSTPFQLFASAPIAAAGSSGATWVIPLSGTRFSGCIKWSASSTSVMGAIVGD